MVMRIKRYEAEEKDLPKVIRQIRRDLGENAVVKTKRFRKGAILGIGGKAVVEVYAGVERDLRPEKSDVRPLSETRHQTHNPLDLILPPASPSDEIYSDTTISPKPQSPVIFQPPGHSPIVNNPNQTGTATSPVLETEVRRLSSEIAEIRRALEESLGSGNRKEPEIIAPLKYPQWLTHLKSKLLENEVDPQVAEQMLDETLKSADAEALLDFEATLAVFQKTIVRNIEARGAMKGTQAPRILTLAGPTGVGKTTTLAKLAATANLLDKQNVGLISADTYRIAAIDQLKTFAGIMDIPLKVVFSPSELREALNEYRNMDRIFIDTAGRSPSDNDKIAELRELVEVGDEVECHLVLSATTRLTDMYKICDRFRSSNFTRFIFTKIDETDNLGPVLGILYKEGTPASYLTNGQSVPDDIILADESDITSLIVRKSLS